MVHCSPAPPSVFSCLEISTPGGDKQTQHLYGVQEESEGGEGGGGVYENSYAAHVLLSVGSCAITPVAFNPFNSV